MDKRTISVMVAEPGKAPYIREISPDMDAMRQIVGHGAGEICPFDNSVSVVYNPEDTNLPFNCTLKNGSDQPYEAIQGTFLIVGVDNGSYVSLTEEQIHRFQSLFSADRGRQEEPA